MKKMFPGFIVSTLLLAATFTSQAFAQNVGIGTASPDASAMLEIVSDNKGFLIPRMSMTKRDAIAGPAKGLMVYVIEDSSLYIFHTKWHKLVPAEEVWSTKGNAGTDPDLQFIGTTDDTPLRFRVNNLTRMEVDGSGRLQLMNGGDNIFIGKRTGLNTTSSINCFIGNGAGESNTTGQENQFIGHAAGNLNTTGYRNFFEGFAAGHKNTTGNENFFIGIYAGHSNETSSFNHFVGHQSGFYNTAGRWNTFNGYQTGFFNTSGDGNDFHGYMAGRSNTTGYLNLFGGYQAGYNNTTGTANIFVGGHSGRKNTTGQYNTFLGCQAGFENLTGNENVFTGLNAGFSNTTGSRNCFIGHVAGYGNTTGSRNTLVGQLADVAYDTLTNAGAIGANAVVSQSNSFVIGGTGTNAVNVGIGTTAPVTRLDVNSNAAFSDIATFRSTGGWGQILINQGTTVTDLGAYPTGGFTGTHNAGDFKIRTGAVDRMFFQHSTGNVGIGTLSPNEKLDVVGRAQFSGGIKLPTAGGTPAVLDYYEEYTLTGNLYSSFTTYVTGYQVKITRVGRQIAITFPASIETMTVAVSVEEIVMSGVPAQFRPVIGNISCAIQVRTNGVWGTGIAIMRTDGNIYLKPDITDPTATWSGAGNAAFSAFTITYSL